MPGDDNTPFLIKPTKVIQSMQPWLRYDAVRSDYVGSSHRPLPPLYTHRARLT